MTRIDTNSRDWRASGGVERGAADRRDGLTN